jgi:N,N'-diacetyllegionaminate synthase
MKLGSFDVGQRVLVIAEIGNNHEGNFAAAQELLGRAAEAGADAVKFQTFIPELFVSRVDAARLQRLRGFQLSQEQFTRLAAQAKELGVVFFSTPLDLESARFLNTIQPMFKIASGDNTFFPLIEAVAGFAKPMIVSTGFADMAALDRVHALVRATWARDGVDPGLAFLHCVGCYPVPPEQANLAVIGALRARFGDCVVGYSDHTIGIRAATYAVAAGARIVEKHFTLDKNYSEFRDHQLSADPVDLRSLVDAIRETEQLMGAAKKAPTACEVQMLDAVRRSIAAARDLPASHLVTAGDLIWVRPGTGLAVGCEDAVVGRRTRRALQQGELIRAEDVAGP